VLDCEMSLLASSTCCGPSGYVAAMLATDVDAVCPDRIARTSLSWQNVSPWQSQMLGTHITYLDVCDVDKVDVL